eukprot:scaffold33263_cov70-Cyclotella_meneghiniana.AAC.4
MSTTDGQLLRYEVLSIDGECEKWAQTSHHGTDADAPPCLSVLSQFYDELMVPTFPLEGELDDLDDWCECFRFQIRQMRWKEQGNYNMQPKDLSDEEQLLLQGNAMDVILIILDTSEESVVNGARAGSLRQFHHQSSSLPGLYAPNSDKPYKKDSSKPLIIGGAAVEYYKEPRVGLLSYIVLHPAFRGQGLGEVLHKEALSRLTRLACLYGKTQESNTLPATSPLIHCVFAETNTAAAGDVTPEQSLKRHKSLYKLGYRLVNFPYAQPPLSTDDVDGSFDDLMLLVYFPFDEDSTDAIDTSTDNAKNFYNWYKKSKGIQSVQMNVSIPFGYVEDFYRSVFGYSAEEYDLDSNGIPDYRTAKYYKLAHWFSREKCKSGFVEVNLCGPPWEDCKEVFFQEMKDWRKDI